MSPIFSILIPAYNVETYLDDCIQSVLSQAFISFEVILIDDGSTDYTGLLCDKYAAKDSRIKVIHKKNEGLLLARRNAIKTAKGKYFVFLDSDDCLKETALIELYHVITDYSPDLIIYRASMDSSFTIPFRSSLFPGGKFLSNQDIIQLKKILCKSDDLNNIWLKCVNARIVDYDFDYYSIRFISNGEDLVQTLPLIDNSSKIYYLDSIIYYYRQTPFSMTKVISLDHVKSIIATHTILNKYATKWQEQEPMIDFTALSKDYAVSCYYSFLKSAITSSKPWNEKKDIISFLLNDSYFHSVVSDRSFFSRIDFQMKLILFLVNKKFYCILYFICSLSLVFFRGKHFILKHFMASN